MTAVWDETKHPRHPPGSPAGGEFAAERELIDRTREAQQGRLEGFPPGEFTPNDSVKFWPERMGAYSGFRQDAPYGPFWKALIDDQTGEELAFWFAGVEGFPHHARMQKALGMDMSKWPLGLAGYGSHAEVAPLVHFFKGTDRERQALSLAQEWADRVVARHRRDIKDANAMLPMEQQDDALAAAGWDESKHSRHPAGSPEGGEFSRVTALPTLQEAAQRERERNLEHVPEGFPPGAFTPENSVKFWPKKMGAYSGNIEDAPYGPLWKAIVNQRTGEEVAFWFASTNGYPHHVEMRRALGLEDSFKPLGYFSGYGNMGEEQWMANRGSKLGAVPRAGHAEIEQEVIRRHRRDIRDANMMLPESQQNSALAASAALNLEDEGLLKAVERLQRQYEKVYRRAAKRTRDAYLAEHRVVTAAVAPPVDAVMDAAVLLASFLQLTGAARRDLLKAIAKALDLLFGTERGLEYYMLLLHDQTGAQAARLMSGAQDAAANILLDSMAQGWTVPQTADALKAKLEQIAPWQATMLARTDLISLSNAASLRHAMGAETAQRYKTWLATPDERTRINHRDAHGQTVPLEQPFTVGGEQLLYPGDPSASDGNVINCRCTLVYSTVPTGPVGVQQIKMLPDLAVSAAGWDEAKHPRDPAGTPEGGQFAIARLRLPEDYEAAYFPVEGFDDTGTFGHMRDLYSDWGGRTTNEEQLALWQWRSKRNSPRIQNWLRGKATSPELVMDNHGFGPEYERRSIDAVVATIDGAIAKAPPLDREVTIYRGVPNTDLAFGAKSPEVGATYEESGYLSGSTKFEKAKGYAYGGNPYMHYSNSAVMRIRIPAGTRAPLLTTAVPDAGNREVLLPRGQQFRITGVTPGDEALPQIKDRSDRLQIIDAELVPTAVQAADWVVTAASPEAMLELHRTRALERARGGVFFDPSKHPRQPAGTEKGGEFREKGAIPAQPTVDQHHARLGFEKWTAGLEKYYENDPEDFQQQKDWLWGRYQESLARSLPQLQARLENAGVTGVRIFTEGDDGDWDALADPEVTHSADYRVQLPADGNALPADFMVWTHEDGTYDVEDVLDIGDKDFFPNGPESPTAQNYAKLVDAARGLPLEAQPDSFVTVYRGMSDKEFDAWEAGEHLDAGKYFTSQPTTQYAMDIDREPPNLRAFRVPRSMLIQTGTDEYQLRQRGRMSAGRIEPVTAAAWDETKHPREPGGTEKGGEFAATPALRRTKSGDRLAERLAAETGPEGVKALWEPDPQDAVATVLDLNNAPSVATIERAKDAVREESRTDLLRRFPDGQITIYRGGSGNDALEAWSLSKSTASFFARGDEAAIREQTVPISAVEAYLPAVARGQYRGFGEEEVLLPRGFTAAGFDESAHPRWPSGSEQGGEFRPKEGIPHAEAARPGQQPDGSYRISGAGGVPRQALWNELSAIAGDELDEVLMSWPNLSAAQADKLRAYLAREYAEGGMLSKEQLQAGFAHQAGKIRQEARYVLRDLGEPGFAEAPKAPGAKPRQPQPGVVAGPNRSLLDTLQIGGGRVGDAMFEAARAVDKTLLFPKVPGEPTIPMKGVNAYRVGASFWRDGGNKPTKISVAINGRSPISNTVHELGHYLDSLLGQDEWATATPTEEVKAEVAGQLQELEDRYRRSAGSSKRPPTGELSFAAYRAEKMRLEARVAGPRFNWNDFSSGQGLRGTLAPVLSAIKQTEMYQRAFDPNQMLGVYEYGGRYYGESRRHMQYLQKPHELIARSFEQYIAAKNPGSKLADEHRVFYSERRSAGYMTPEDAALVNAAWDKVLAERGLLRSAQQGRVAA